MEHISGALQNLSQETNIHRQKTFAEKEPTLEEKREQLRKSLGVSSLENTFANFKRVAGTGKALAAFKVLAKGKTDKPLLLCYGGVGNGKTYLCEAAAIALYKRGFFCRVLTMDTMISALKRCMDPEPIISYEELLGNYSYAERLIIDDVEGTDWAFGELEKIIRVRYREKLLTIMTSNRDLAELKERSERIVSRFSDPEVGMVVLNEGEDYRRLKSENSRAKAQA